MDKIMVHETVHIRQMHSLDAIFAEIICILTWFNPVSWMIKSALKETHEYLADSEVSEQTTDKAGYLQLLLLNVIGVQPGLANNFNKSLTLKRLKMMTKPRSGRLSRMKVLLVLPLVVMLVSAFSVKYSNNSQNVKDASAIVRIEKADNPVDKMPEYKGGQEAMMKFLVENIKYPEDAKNKGIQGKVFVNFVVSKTGKIQDVSVAQSVNPLLDAEAVRVISSMPNWTPGEDKGKKVDVQITLPINFKLGDK
ncbi:MAG: hypothetical protein CVU05_01170 [Bacteroidetes bacterium HGW-Bacteroidetes-21]|nr:MAG: hypothetical protein CVU05_01170 [Bacteroidetes bacterium HGW-Bacteroidetes-21]